MGKEKGENRAKQNLGEWLEIQQIPHAGFPVVGGPWLSIPS